MFLGWYKYILLFDAFFLSMYWLFLEKKSYKTILVHWLKLPVYIASPIKW